MGRLSRDTSKVMRVLTAGAEGEVHWTAIAYDSPKKVSTDQSDFDIHGHL